MAGVGACVTVETRNAERFWIWTELNRARIRETLKAARRSIPGVHIVLVDPLVCEMTSELHAYDDRLSPLIALAKDDVLELTITADARVEAFGSVDTLMSLAPIGPVCAAVTKLATGAARFATAAE